MATIWAWTKNLKLRNKLAIIYTVAFTLILGVTFLVIYTISEKYREEQFYKRLSDRTFTTFIISVQVDQIDNNLLKLFDQNTTNSLSDEKVLLFDSSGKLIYSSTDTGDISYSEVVLKQLHGEDNVFEHSGDKYEMLGLRFKDKNHTYYGITKAYDRFGKSKIHFLRLLLISAFFIVTLLIILLSFILSKIVTKPITRLTHDLSKISPDNLSNRINMVFAQDEIGFLASKFNDLLEKVENAFKFQYHYINHLSHELKTPLAIMMANAERSLVEDENEKLKSSMQFQKNAIMELSHIINAMLDISKMEKKLTTIDAESIRIDEIIFECMEEISILNTNARFDFKIDAMLEEKNLTLLGNSRMIKMAVLNLVKNAVNFSSKQNPSIEISTSKNLVHIKILNDGEVIDSGEQLKLFKHSFRGKNSLTIKGFGLGLVLANRIVGMHKGTLSYSVEADMLNCFILSLPTVSR